MYKSCLRVYKSAIMVLLALSIGSLQAQGTQPIRWNVLFFMCDMQNVHFMSPDKQAPQNIYTPNLDRLAKEGMTFDKAYDAFPVCAPTRASIITGEYPQKHGQMGNDQYLIEGGPGGKTPSVGHVFRGAGYNTALLGKTHSNVQQWDMSPDSLYQGKNIFVGFDYRLDDPGESSLSGQIPSSQIYTAKQTLYTQKYAEALTGAPNPSWEAAVWATVPNPPFGGGNMGNITAKSTDGMMFLDALEYLNEYAKGKANSSFKINDPVAPFIMYLSFKMPHGPWRAPNMHDSIDFYAMYSGRPEDDNLTYRHKNEMRKKIIPTNLTFEDTVFDMSEDDGWPKYGDYIYPIPPAAMRLARARYSSAVSWVDHLLGRVMDRLAQLDDPNNPGKKLSETTIMTYTVDHGDMMGEKHRMSKMNMHEGSARVPFLVRMPGVLPANVRSNVLINHVDMLPTIAGLCGLGPKLRTGMAGKDLSAAVKQNNAILGQVRTFTVCQIKAPDVHPGHVMGRTQQYKFIRFSTKQTNGLPYMVLFDIDNDPHETKNLADDPKFAAIVNRESAAMDTFLLSFGVPPANLRLTVSTKFSTATPGSALDLEVVNGSGRISFIPGQNLRVRNGVVDISIYSPTGALLKRIAFDSKNGTGYSWNLRTDAGHRVKSNLYLYRYSLKNEQGREISKAGKLIRAGM